MCFIENFLRRTYIEDNAKYNAAWGTNNQQKKPKGLEPEQEIWIILNSFSAEACKPLRNEVFHFNCVQRGDEFLQLEETRNDQEKTLHWVKHIKTGAEFKCFDHHFKKKE